MKQIHWIMSSLVLISVTPVGAQTASDIYLFDVKRTGEHVVLSGGHNITKHVGYDNQPHFHPSQPLIFYSSFDESGRSDIKRYDLSTKKTKLFTSTNEREYSPTVTPDGKFISCIIQRDDGAQDLGKYPVAGGEPITLIDNLIVGYHAWMTDDHLILFVLGDTITLRWFDLKTGKDKILAENIGRSLHRIPGEKAMSFVHKDSDENWMIKRLDSQTLEISEIVGTLPGQEHLTWTPDGRILMSDGNKIYICNPKGFKKEGAYQPIDLGQAKLTGITRLAMSRNGKHLAVVADDAADQ